MSIIVQSYCLIFVCGFSNGLLMILCGFLKLLEFEIIDPYMVEAKRNTVTVLNCHDKPQEFLEIVNCLLKIIFIFICESKVKEQLKFVIVCFLEEISFHFDHYVSLVKLGENFLTKFMIFEPRQLLTLH